MILINSLFGNVPDVVWISIGWCGQVFFFSRFLIQWVVSEIKKESVIPLAFWYLSIIGGLGLLTYAIYRRDPVFIVGNALGILVYTRNLFLRNRKAA